MLRVLQLGPVPPPWGGVQTNLEGIHRYLLQHKHRSACLNITRHRRSNSAEAYFPHSALEVIRLLWTLPYDILHLHVGGELSRRILALCLAVTSVPGKRSVLSFHSGGYPSSSEGRAAARASWRGSVLRRFDRVVVVNDELRQVFLRYGVQEERCRLILPYWVPLEAPDLEDIPLKDFYAAHAPVFLSVGLLEPEYDLPRQLDAFAQLREEYPSAGLVWVGSGSLESSLRERLAIHPHGRAVLLRGDLARPQTLAAIARASVLWRTTLYDGDAVSVREALHFGTHVLATDNGMRPANVRLIAPANTAMLVDATRQLLAAPRPARQIQDGEANLRAMLNLYEEFRFRS